MINITECRRIIAQPHPMELRRVSHRHLRHRMQAGDDDGVGGHVAVSSSADDLGQPVTIRFVAAIDRVFVGLLETGGDRTLGAVADHAFVD